MKSTNATHFTKKFSFFLLVITSASPFWAQRGQGGAAANVSFPWNSTSCTPGDPNYWNPSESPAAMAGWHSGPVQKGYGMTARQERAGIVLLDQLDQIMRRIPALNPAPPGIQLYVRKSVGNELLPGQSFDLRKGGPGPEGRLSAFYDVDFDQIYRKPDNSFGAGAADGGYIIAINQFERPLAGRDTPADAPQQVGEFQGYPVFQSRFGGFILMTKRNSLPWSYTTLREYADQQWKKLEKKAPLPTDEIYKVTYQQELTEFKTKLATFSPAELDAPVYINPSKGYNMGLDRVTTPSDKGPLVHRLAYANDTFWDTHLPLNAVQFIAIGVHLNSRNYCRFVNLEKEVHNQIDFKALEQLLQ